MSAHDRRKKSFDSTCSRLEIGSVGYSFRKFFPGYGWFDGRVVQIRRGAECERDRRCIYSDGDTEDLSLAELRQLAQLDPCNKKARGESSKCLPNSIRKSSREPKPSKKFLWDEHYQIEDAVRRSASKKSSSTLSTVPKFKRPKLLTPSIGEQVIPIDKAAESTLCPRDQTELTKSIFSENDDEERNDGWLEKVASLLGADTSIQKQKRILRPVSRTSLSSMEGFLDGSSEQQSSLNQSQGNAIATDMASECSTISCSSDNDVARSLSITKEASDTWSKQPPKAVLVSHSSSATATAMHELFLPLCNFEPGYRHGLKVINEKDPQRVVGEVILEHKYGWIEVILDGTVEKLRASSLLVVPSDRFELGDRIPASFDQAVTEKLHTVTKSNSGRKVSNKPSLATNKLSANEKRNLTQSRRTNEYLAGIDSLFYWYCEDCNALNKVSDVVCLSCHLGKSSRSNRSSLLMIAEKATENSVSTVEEALLQVPLAQRRCIPEIVLSELIAIKTPGRCFSEFCVEPSLELDTYFYWICGSCTMQNSYKKTKCGACLQVKGHLFENSPVLGIAEAAALNSKTAKEAYSLIPDKDKRSIPDCVMEALVTCNATVGKKGDFRRCRKQKLSGYDFCVAHCDPVLLTTPRIDVPFCDAGSFTQTKEDSPSRASFYTLTSAASSIRGRKTQESLSCGIAPILEIMPAFLGTKIDNIMVNELRWSVRSIEDSLLCEESKPFPLGMKARKFFTNYGFHDGRIIKICRKFLVDKSGQVQRPVLVYRMVYNDGDQEDFLHHEISSLCQIYDRRNIPSEAPPSSQIPPGTMLETQAGKIIRVVEHITPPGASNQNEGGIVMVYFDESSKAVELDLLQLQLIVLRKAGFQGLTVDWASDVLTNTACQRMKDSSSHEMSMSQNSLSETFHGATTSVLCAPSLEWPGRGRSISIHPSQSDDGSIGMDEQHVICPGLFLRRKVRVSSLDKSSVVLPSFASDSKAFLPCTTDEPSDVRVEVDENGAIWDPGNAHEHLLWDPYLTVLCAICNVDKDDHQIVICDGCHSGYHTYCVRPVMVNIPKEDWLCSSCATGRSDVLPFKEYARQLRGRQQETIEFLRLPFSKPLDFLETHAEALNMFSSSTHSSVRQQALSQHRKGVVFNVGSLHFVRDPQKHDWRIPTPLSSEEQYVSSVTSFVAAMRYCGMARYSEDLLYPDAGNAKEEMNNCAADIDLIHPMSKRNVEIFRAFKDNLKKGAFPPVRVVHDENFGFSVEALAVIPRHTLIGEYVGEITTIEQSGETSSDSLMVLLNTGNAKTSLIIDPTRAGNIARFLSGINNRSLVSRRKANVRTRRFSLDGKCRVALFTSRRIEPGEKLHYDYNAGVEGKSAEEWAEAGFYDTSNFF